MSGVPQGPVLALAMFNIFVGNMDSEIECTLSKFSDNTELCSAVERLEREVDAIQRNLERLERWACANLIKFNKAKCKVLQVDRGKPKHKYRLGREWIQDSPEEKDSGVLVDKKLSMTRRCTLAAQQANRALGCNPSSVGTGRGRDSAPLPSSSNPFHQTSL